MNDLTCANSQGGAMLAEFHSLRCDVCGSRGRASSVCYLVGPSLSESHISSAIVHTGRECKITFGGESEPFAGLPDDVDR